MPCVWGAWSCLPCLVVFVQVETRPLTLVEATADDGSTYSTLLQNAETVRLVGPAADGDDLSQARNSFPAGQGASVRQLL